MSVIRIPTPLRAYTEGRKEIEVDAATVGAALEELARRYPALRAHLYDEDDGLRPYVNVFVNQDDVRDLQGEATRLADGDRVMIVPSIAGGAEGIPLKPVDHAALRANQAAIIGLLLAAFIGDAAWLAGAVGAVMLLGMAFGRPGFLFVYRALRSARLLRPDVIPDNPEPHRFAQGLGGAVLLAGLAGGLSGSPALAWIASWLVIALAALNLFAGFCVGCAFYYWLNRLGVPGFRKAPPPGTFPGRRPAPSE
jgi:MoaD family protein